LRRSVAVLLLLTILTVAPAFSQFVFPQIPVIDVANLASAVERLWELREQYAQMVQTYQQLVLEYRHMVRMAMRVPNIGRFRFTGTPWRLSASGNTYGTTAGWTSAINSGLAALQGYRLAVERLEDYGPAFGRIPADQLDRARTRYATVELADAANVHGIEVAGSQRSKAVATTGAIDALEDATLTGDDAYNTEIAVLNKINAGTVMALRSGQDTNQLLIALLEQSVAESKARRDAETSAINANVSLRLHARDAGSTGIRGTTDAITTFRMP
jgi:hypothetical protein